MTYYYDVETPKRAKSLAPSVKADYIGRFIISDTTINLSKRVHPPRLVVGVPYIFKDEECKQVYFDSHYSNDRLYSKYYNNGFVPDKINTEGLYTSTDTDKLIDLKDEIILFQIPDGIAFVNGKRYLVVNNSFGINLDDTSDVLPSFPQDTVFRPISSPMGFEGLSQEEHKIILGDQSFTIEEIQNAMYR